MSEIRVDNITDEAGTGKPGFPNGITATGAALTDPEITGGIHLGGTGSANYLDDYEEGTWTPSIDGLTFNEIEAEYTKVGNLVYVSLELDDGSGSANSSFIQGLPFLGKSSITYSANSIYIGEIGGGVSGLVYHGRVTDGDSDIRILKRVGTTADSCSNSEVPTKFIRFSFSYLTDS